MRNIPIGYDKEQKIASFDFIKKVSTGSNLMKGGTSFGGDFIIKGPKRLSEKKTGMTKVLLLIIFIGYIGYIYIHHQGNFQSTFTGAPKKHKTGREIHKYDESSRRQTCPPSYHNIGKFTSNHSSSSCPSYFRWIYQDLKPWREVGITRNMIEKAKKFATFRLVILDGKVYVEKFEKSIQTRDIFTLWGILQLLRFYPGRLPDLELMFSCGDRPTIMFVGQKARPPVPLFRYCGNDHSFDIVFPDWSFWGWAEINTKPWTIALEDIIKGNERSKWRDRVPLAYWKGNPTTASTRRHFMNCNVSDQNDWKTRLYIQDWDEEAKASFQHSKLEDQCTYRYKIYIEGWAWSVSEKYIMACNSMTLYIKSHYYDFFSRELIPLKHYWPIRDESKCTSLKHAVEWGNSHPEKAEEIGRVGSDFIKKDLKMEYVYDYMFHLLNEYAKMLKFKPIVPQAAEEINWEKIMASAENSTPNLKNFMADSLVSAPKIEPPCAMPHTFDPLELKQFVGNKAKIDSQVKIWENQYLHSLIMKAKDKSSI